MPGTMTLHAPPGPEVALNRQAWLLLRSRRVLSLGLLSVVLLLVSEMTSRTFEAMDLSQPPAAVLMTFSLLWVFGGLWALWTWREEAPARRGYHTSLPVDRVWHDVARVVAGAGWLCLVVAATLLLGLVLAAARGQVGQLTQLPLWLWASAFTAPLLPYLFVSAATVALNRPLEWLLGGFAVVLVSATLADRFGFAAWPGLLEKVAAGSYGFFTTMQHGATAVNRLTTTQLAAQMPGATMPIEVQHAMQLDATWVFAVLVWVALGSLCVWLAAHQRRLA